MAAPMPFSFDLTARPALLAEALAVLAALEVNDPTLVPVAIPTSAGRRVVFMYLDDATFLPPSLDERQPAA